MKTTHQPLFLAASLAAVLALTACGKKEEPATPAPVTPPPAAASTAPAATPPMGGAAMPVSVTAVDLGSTIDAGNKILAAGTSFAPKDNIYASVGTNGSGTATLDAKWSYQDGQVVHQDSKTLAADAGEQVTAFMLNKPDGFPAGNYKVEILLNGVPAASKDFAVK